MKELTCTAVAVSVVRKVDAGRWPELFAVLGAPQDWLQAALDANDIVSAASCLIPLQHRSGPAAAVMAAFRLLDIALSHDDYDVRLALAAARVRDS